MPEFHTYELDGRSIRIRPNEKNTGEIDSDGVFHRQPNRFTEGFGAHGRNPVEAGRYLLAWAKGCNWSNRAAIVRELLGIEGIDVTIVDQDADYPANLGWEFGAYPDHIQPDTGYRFLSEAYYATDDSYAGRTTVPALIDKTTGKVVNNDYHFLTNHFEVDFRPLHRPGAPDLYPEALRQEIDALNVWLFHNVNNAIYRCQFAGKLSAFAQAYEELFAGLDAMDARLKDRRFLFGDYVTDSDVRLYTSLARFEYSYARNLDPCKKRLVDYENLWPYARDLWQIPAFRHNTYFRDFAARHRHSAQGVPNAYYSIVLPQTDFDGIWGAPTGRERLSSDPANKFRPESEE